MSTDVFHASPLRGASGVPPEDAAPEELRRQCAALRERELFLRQVLSSMYTGLLVADCDGRIRSANQALLVLLGYREDELVGRELCTLLSEAGAKMDAQDFVDEILSMSEAQLLITKNGGFVEVLISPTVMFDDAGAIRCVVCTVLDLTEHRRLEAELAQTQKLEAIGGLAAGIAHDIASPLQYIATNAEYLNGTFSEIVHQIGAKSDPLSGRDWNAEVAEIGDACASIRDGIDRIAKLVRALGEYAHPAQSEIGRVDINQIVSRTLIICRHEYRHVAEVETELGELPAVQCNAQEISRVILNLVVNAAHAIADSGGGKARRGRITIRTWAADGHVLISIADDGHGIPAAIRHRIFEPFFTTKEVGRGTGQGLSIARSIVVDRHQGSLGVETEEGRGTVFLVRLPTGPG